MNSEVIIEDLQRMSETSLPWQELDGKTVLVTGATGMLASYVAWLLLYLREHQGIQINVVALCRNQQKAEQYFGAHIGKPYFHLLLQDVCDPINYEGEIDYVFHLAGHASPHFINTDPVGIMKSNLLGTLHVLELAKAKQSTKVVFASTREVYGKNEEAALLDEKAFGSLDPLEARSCYPESKRASESLLMSYWQQYQVPFNTVRIAHSYGPTMTFDNDGRVMADLLGDAIAGRDIVLKSQGDAIRSFVYVTDAVLGLFTVLFAGEPGQAYNLANETEPIAIKDLAHLIASMKAGIRVIHDIPKDSLKGYCNYRRTALDTTSLERLGWHPQVTLKSGLRRVFHKF